MGLHAADRQYLHPRLLRVKTRRNQFSFRPLLSRRRREKWSVLFFLSQASCVSCSSHPFKAATRHGSATENDPRPDSHHGWF